MILKTVEHNPGPLLVSTRGACMVLAREQCRPPTCRWLRREVVDCPGAHAAAGVWTLPPGCGRCRGAALRLTLT